MAEDEAVIYVVDDEQAMRQALRSLLQSVGLTVLAFPSAREFLAAELKEAPACLVLDIRLPGLSGLDLQRELTSRNIQIPIIFISGHADVAMTVQAMKGGAAEFFTKPFRDQDLLDAVQEAVERDRTARQQRAELATLLAHFDTLTPREREVMQLVVTGMPNKKIAVELRMSEVTVKLHRGRVMQKMGASSLPELVRMAERLPHVRKAKRAG
jgi:FixJ family two-component response regulator